MYFLALSRIMCFSLMLELTFPIRIFRIVIFFYFLVLFIKPGARNPRWTEEETIMLCTLVKNNRFVIHVSSFTDSKQLEKLLILCFVIYCFNFLMQETCILNSIAQLGNDAV